MRIATPILLGSFLLIAPAAPAPSQPAPPDFGPQTAINADSARQRDTYIQKSEEELDDWQARLLRLDKPERGAAATMADLESALDKAGATAYRLQTVAADGLEDANVSYQKATGELADAWETSGLKTAATRRPAIKPARLRQRAGGWNNGIAGGI